VTSGLAVDNRDATVVEQQLLGKSKHRMVGYWSVAAGGQSWSFAVGMVASVLMLVLAARAICRDDVSDSGHDGGLSRRTPTGPDRLHRTTSST
jgi:hypothetical protein